MGLKMEPTSEASSKYDIRYLYKFSVYSSTKSELVRTSRKAVLTVFKNMELVWIKIQVQHLKNYNYKQINFSLSLSLIYFPYLIKITVYLIRLW